MCGLCSELEGVCLAYQLKALLLADGQDRQECFVTQCSETSSSFVFLCFADDPSLPKMTSLLGSVS